MFVDSVKYMSSSTVGYGEDDGPGSSIDHHLPGSVSHGDT